MTNVSPTGSSNGLDRLWTCLPPTLTSTTNLVVTESMLGIPSGCWVAGCATYVKIHFSMPSTDCVHASASLAKSRSFSRMGFQRASGAAPSSSSGSISATSSSDLHQQVPNPLQSPTPPWQRQLCLPCISVLLSPLLLHRSHPC